MSSEKKCPVCETELVDNVCPKCKKETKNETGNPVGGQAVSNTGSGWGASINREPFSRTSGSGFCNG